MAPVYGRAVNPQVAFDVDADDLDALSACWSGPNVPVAPSCAAKDLDRDNDVDATDYILLQPCMSGEGNPAPLECTQAAPPNGSFAVHGLTVDAIPGGPTLLFARARHYDPKLGRWLQRDPKGYIDGPNLYEAFLGNALTWVDPFGREGDEASKGRSKWDRRLRWRPGMVPRNEEQWKTPAAPLAVQPVP